MNRFVTLDEGAKTHRAVLWEETEGSLKVSGHFATLADVPDHEGLQVWTFDVPTTMQVESEANVGRYPMVDVDGAPLWEGARIAFELQSTYINTYSGKGTFGTASQHGGHSFTSDQAYPYWGPGGFSSSSGMVRTNPGGEYVRSGPLAGYLVLGRKLGDPHEHGTRQTYVRLDDDPREVCTLTLDPDASPSP